MPKAYSMQRLTLMQVLTAACAFASMVLLLAATFYLLPLPVLVIGTLFVAAFGWAATARMVRQVATFRCGASLFALSLLTATWLAWCLLPSNRLGASTILVLRRPAYEAAITQTRGGALPECLERGECHFDGRTPPYLAFPIRSLLQNWEAIVHVPGDEQAPQPERLGDFAALAGCNPKPLAPHYFLCFFI